MSIAIVERSGPLVSLIVEEKPICADALGQCLRVDCGLDEVFIEATLAGEAPAPAGRLVVALVDLATINYDFAALEAFVSRLAPCPVVAIDDRPNPAFSRIADQSHCRGYIAKTFDREQFSEALRSIISGHTWFYREDAEGEGRPAGSSARALPVLTERQSDVLAFIARGCSNEEISRELGISVGTVKTHVHTVLKRIGARNRTEAAIVAPRFRIHG